MKEVFKDAKKAKKPKKPKKKSEDDEAAERVDEDGMPVRKASRVEDE